VTEPGWLVEAYKIVEASLLVVTSEIPAKITNPHGADKSREKQNHHQCIEDGEPVDLILEEIRIQVTLESGFEFLVGLLPIHGISELHTQLGVGEADLHWISWLHLGRDDLVAIVSQLKILMREQRNCACLLVLLAHQSYCWPIRGGKKPNVSIITS
jgi:hypothetical protein